MSIHKRLKTTTDIGTDTGMETGHQLGALLKIPSKPFGGKRSQVTVRRFQNQWFGTHRPSCEWLETYTTIMWLMKQPTVLYKPFFSIRSSPRSIIPRWCAQHMLNMTLSFPELTFNTTSSFLLKHRTEMRLQFNCPSFSLHIASINV